MTASRPSFALDAETLLTHAEWLASFARALVSNESELDDVVQQTFVRALEQPPRHAQNVRGWLGTVARNIVRSNARSNTARVSREIALPPPPPVENPVEAVARTELRRMVVEAVLALEEPYRSCIALRFFEEQDVAAIARLTQSNEDTVRTRIRRGVMRVRELLERKVDDRARGGTDERAAARALLFAGLREMAAGGGRPAGTVGGGAAGHATSSRILARAGGRSTTIATRRILIGATAVLVGAGGWWWWRGEPRRQRVAPIDSASRAVPAAQNPEAQPAVSAARAADAVAPKAPEVPPPPVPAAARFALRGTIHGVVTDPDGRPVARAKVWAIPSPDHQMHYHMPDFEWSLWDRARLDPSLHTIGDWIEAATDEEGRYQVPDLSTMPAWVIGAYEPTVGAMVVGTFSFDQAHVDAVADVRMMPGTLVQGLVLDEQQTPIGNVHVHLFLHGPKSEMEARTATLPSGPSVGEFDMGFRCGDPIEVECRAPGFIDLPRTRIPVALHASPRRVHFTMTRSPGTLVRGRIVDASGKAFDLEPVVAKLYPTSRPGGRAALAHVLATPAEAPATGGGEAIAKSALEGRINYVTGNYEVVVPDGFHGVLELRIDQLLLGTATLADLNSPPDLPCDEARLPAEHVMTKFQVRFVDAISKEAIDLEHEDVLPIADNADSSFQVVKGECDLRHGLVAYLCDPGFLRINAWVFGYVPTFQITNCPKDAPTRPMTMELARATSRIHGTLFHPDGRPYPNAPLTLYRQVSQGAAEPAGFPLNSNADGDFEIDALAEGDHFVVVPGGDGEATAVVHAVASAHGPEVEVHVKAGSATRFRIVMERPPEPLPPRHFMIIDGNGVLVESLNRDPALDGSPNDFSVTIESGHYTCVVDRAGFQTDSVEFDVPANEPVSIPLTPAKPRSR